MIKSLINFKEHVHVVECCCNLSILVIRQKSRTSDRVIIFQGSTFYVHIVS